MRACVRRTRVIETVGPLLRVGLSAVNGADVVRLRVVVPSSDLDEIEETAVGNDLLPAGVVQVRVGVVDPLAINQQSGKV